MNAQRITIVLAWVLLLTSNTHGQDRLLWLKLSGNRVMHEVTIQSLEDDTMGVRIQAKVFFIPLSIVEQVRELSESGMLKDAGLGAAIGMGLGALVGLTIQDNGESSAPWLRTAMLGGILGAVAGSVIGGFHDDGVIVLSGMANAEKRQVLQEFIKEP